MLDPLSDPPHEAVANLHLRHVLEIHQRIAGVPVDGEQDRPLLEPLRLKRYEQALVDHVIRHQEHERVRLELVLGLQDG